MIAENTRKIRAFTVVVLVLALVAAVVRTVMLTKIVEPDTGFYSIGAQWGHCFDVSVLVLIIAMVFIGKRLFKHVETADELDSGSTATVFGSALCAFMFFSVFVYGMYLWFVSETPTSLLFKAEILLCLPCGFNHLCICAKEKRNKTASQAVLAMSVPVLFALRVIEVFMSTDTQINTSQRSLELLMLCAMMLFYLYESAFLVERNGEENALSYAHYYVAALAATSLTALAAVPYLLVSVFWVFESNFVMMDVLECCIMIYAAVRVFTAKLG